MNIEKIIRAWKADTDDWEWETPGVVSPVGQRLTEKELLEVSGGDNCVITACTVTCGGNTCGNTPCFYLSACTATGCVLFTMFF